MYAVSACIVVAKLCGSTVIFLSLQLNIAKWHSTAFKCPMPITIDACDLINHRCVFSKFYSAALKFRSNDLPDIPYSWMCLGSH